MTILKNKRSMVYSTVYLCLIVFTIALFDGTGVTVALADNKVISADTTVPPSANNDKNGLGRASTVSIPSSKVDISTAEDKGSKNTIQRNTNSTTLLTVINVPAVNSALINDKKVVTSPTEQKTAGNRSKYSSFKLKPTSTPGQSISYVTTARMSFQPNNVKATSWMAKRYSIKNSKPSTSTIQSQAFKLLTARYSPPNEQYKSQYTGQSNVQYNAQHNSQFSTRHFINEPHKDDVVATTTAAKKPSQKVHINTKKVVTSTTSEYASTTEYEKRRRCQAKVSTEFYPSATTCENDRSDRICAYLFDEPDPITGQRDPKCNLAGMEDIADSCRKQCAICCEKIEYACEDDHNDIISCSKQLDKCHVSKWFDVLTKFCAGSCGLCTRSECRDYDVNCREIKDQCLQSDKIDDMREKCARTCGFCVVGGQGINEMPLKKPPVPQCIDTAENCTKNEHLCASPLHAEFMIKYCAKTCFKCSVGPNVIVPVIGTPHDINGTAAVLMPASVIMEAAVHNSKICEDRHPKCAIWVSKGFCTHEKYTLQQRQALCPKSCKLC